MDGGRRGEERRARSEIAMRDAGRRGREKEKGEGRRRKAKGIIL